MKAYLIQVLVVDHDRLGAEEVKGTLENTKYPNWCISPQVLSTRELDIGEWHDDHPLNDKDSVGPWIQNLHDLQAQRARAELNLDFPSADRIQAKIQKHLKGGNEAPLPEEEIRKLTYAEDRT